MSPTPETVEQLNDWLSANFNTAQGPRRAYFELPFDYEIQGQSLRHTKGAIK